MKSFILILIFLSGLATGLLIDNLILTGEVVAVDNEYSWTRAICNSENECIDVVIYCKNGEVVDLEPLLYKVKHPDDWKDFRESGTIFCK